jgi:hypothetical protein
MLFSTYFFFILAENTKVSFIIISDEEPHHFHAAPGEIFVSLRVVRRGFTEFRTFFSLPYIPYVVRN